MRAATEGEVWLALAEGGTWPVALSGTEDWLSLDALAGTEIRGAVAGRIAARLGGCDLKVAESTLVLGLAARLWGALLGPVTRYDVLPDPAGLVWHDDDGALQLGISEPHGWREVTAAGLAQEVTRALSPVIESIGLAPRLLWGNVASALHAAPRVLELPQAQGIVTELLQLPPFAGEVLQGRRTTCCLFYKVPGGGLCGDCVLTREPAPRA